MNKIEQMIKNLVFKIEQPHIQQVKDKMSKAENRLTKHTLPTRKLMNEYFDNFYKDHNRDLQKVGLIKCTPIIDNNDPTLKKIYKKNTDEEHIQTKSVVAAIKTVKNYIILALSTM